MLGNKEMEKWQEIEEYKNETRIGRIGGTRKSN